MNKPNFVYVIYIAASSDRVWNAITDGALTKEYWGGNAVESDWKTGSTFRFVSPPGQPSSAEGTVLESDPPKKLVLAWRSRKASDQSISAATRVTFTLAPATTENVRLTIEHEEYETGSLVGDDVRNGWPAILSSLKTFLETGAALAVTKQWGRTER